jgi:hypothetical protein
LALAKKLIEAGHALGGNDLHSEAPIKHKRRAIRRRRIVRADHAATRQLGGTSSTSARPQAKGRRISDTGWTATMLKVLVEADRPMAYAELKAALAKTHLAPKLLRTDKSFYGAIGKLDAKKVAVRHNGRISATAVYERFQRDVASGIAKDEPVRNTGGEHRSPVKAALFEFLKTNPQGARAGEIINALSKRADLNLTDKNSLTAVYNLIARLVRREVLVRDGSIVRLPHHGNGTHDNAMPSMPPESAKTAEGELPLVRH